jgi:hypothetical protein
MNSDSVVGGEMKNGGSQSNNKKSNYKHRRHKKSNGGKNSPNKQESLVPPASRKKLKTDNEELEVKEGSDTKQDTTNDIIDSESPSKMNCEPTSQEVNTIEMHLNTSCLIKI